MAAEDNYTQLCNVLSRCLSPDDILKWNHMSLSKILLMTTKFCNQRNISIDQTISYFFQYIKEIWFDNDTNLEKNINSRALMIEMINLLYIERTQRYTQPSDFVMVEAEQDK